MQVFKCIPRSARLSTESCAAQHRATRAKSYKLNEATQREAQNPICGSCPLGAAHARGERPDTWPARPPKHLGRWEEGAPVVRTELDLPRAPTSPTRPKVLLPVVEGVLTTQAERQVHRPPPKRKLETWLYNGAPHTARQLAAIAGCSTQAIRWRLRSGKTPEDAVEHRTTASRAAKQQPRARAGRPQRTWELGGEVLTCAQLAARAGCTFQRMYDRLARLGMSAEAAVAAGEYMPTTRADLVQRWEYRGQHLTAKELAALAGCGCEAMRSRLRALRPHESAEDAVALGARVSPADRRLPKPKGPPRVSVQASIPPDTHQRLLVISRAEQLPIAHVVERIIERRVLGGPAPAPSGPKPPRWAAITARFQQRAHQHLEKRARREGISVPMLVRRLVEAELRQEAAAS